MIDPMGWTSVTGRVDRTACSIALVDGVRVGSPYPK